MKRNSKKGFTLAELLIVVAIIAILVAIMLPVFGAQLAKARLATDLANVRSKYSELITANLMGGTGSSINASVTVSAGADVGTGNTSALSVSCKELQKACVYGSTVSGSGKGATITVKLTYGGNDYTGYFTVDSDVNVVS